MPQSHDEGHMQIWQGDVVDSPASGDVAMQRNNQGDHNLGDVGGRPVILLGNPVIIPVLRHVQQNDHLDYHEQPRTKSCQPSCIQK